jgi:hypothetical protein
VIFGWLVVAIIHDLEVGVLKWASPSMPAGFREIVSDPGYESEVAGINGGALSTSR